MDITVSNINWLAAIPLGFVSLFFGALGLRRSSHFFNHENNASQDERGRDLLLSTLDLCAWLFCLLLALSPTKSWLVMIPIGLASFIVVIPVSILGSYYQLHVVTGFMPRNAGIKISMLNEKTSEKLPWYEFTALPFILGWLMFFLVKIAALLADRIVGNPQGTSSLSTIVGVAVGTITGVVITLVAFRKSKAG